MDLTTHHTRRERAQPLFIMAALLVAYVGLASPNLTYDGAAFITWYHEHGAMHPHHPLWGYFLNVCLNAGRAAGLTLMQAGQMQSAFTAAAAGALYFAWLRRLGIGMQTATLFAMVFGLSGTVLEIATTVELYGVALLAIVLSLHAWLSEAKEPTPSGAIELWIACLLVVAFHVAWSIWALVIYLTLAWGERARPGRALGRIVEGAAVGGVIAGWLVWGRFGGHDVAREGHFFSMFFAGGATWPELLARPFATLFNGPILNGGLLTMVAVPGVMVLRKNTPFMYRAIVLATAFFFVCFGFWTPDRGEFFLPVLALWGLAGALVVDRLSLDRRRTVILMIVALLYSVFLSIGYWSSLKWPFIIIFYTLAAAEMNLWKDPGEVVWSTPGSPWLPRGLYALMFVLTIAMYLPPAVTALQPDAVTRKLNVFTEIAPPGARLVTEIPPYRPFAQTGHESISIGDAPGAVDVNQAQAILAQWVQDLQSGGPGIWFDEKMWAERKTLLGPINWAGLSIQRDARKGGAFYGVVKD